MAFPIVARIRDRGATPRKMRPAFNSASKLSWYATALEFHQSLRDKRFTEQHARAAGYAHRKGELLPRGSKAFRQSYTGRKLRMFGHTRPLEFSGETRRKVRFARISSGHRFGRIAYPGASKFNFRHPRSRIVMSEEFRRITQAEAQYLGEIYDADLDKRLADGK